MAVDILRKDRSRERETSKTCQYSCYKKHPSLSHDCPMIVVSDDCLVRLSDRLIVDIFKSWYMEYVHPAIMVSGVDSMNVYTLSGWIMDWWPSPKRSDKSRSVHR